MKNLTYLLISILMTFQLNLQGQQSDKFDIVSYNAPAGWTKEPGNDFVAYTISDKSAEYARILIFKSLPGSGNVNTDFDAEWKELVQLNYNPGSFTQTSVSDYKDGWVSKIGVAPFKFQNANHAAVLLTQVKAKTKMSFVFISNTTKYQAVFEDFGSSLAFGDSQTVQISDNNPQRNEPPATRQSGSSVVQQKNQPALSQGSGFTYTTSNFDDGWTASIQNDWVLVEKGNARVYLFYAVPYNSDKFSGTGVMDRDYYWDNFVAQQFHISSKQYNDAGEFVSSLKPKYVEGIGTDLVTGRPAFISMILSVSPNAAQLTVASLPDEASFRQFFPKANDKYVSDLANMNRYNKFAVSATDITGTWQSGGSQMTQWYDALTGNYAGATIASSSATFHFYTNGSYSSIHNGATGAVGAMNTFQQEYKGNSNVTNWNIVLTNQYQGKANTFDTHFQAVRGGRLLYMNNRAGSEYLLVRIK